MCRCLILPLVLLLLVLCACRMVVVLGSFMILGTPLHSSLFVAVSMVTASLYLYNVPASIPVSAMASKDFELSSQSGNDEDDPTPLLADQRNRV